MLVYQRVVENPQPQILQIDTSRLEEPPPSLRGAPFIAFRWLDPRREQRRELEREDHGDFMVKIYGLDVV